MTEQSASFCTQKNSRSLSYLLQPKNIKEEELCRKLEQVSSSSFCRDE